MTDKQIIIDGVDVSGCPHIEYDHKWWDIAGREQNSENVCSLSFDNNADFDEDFICGQNPNCYYKQLKRKEQEVKELKEEVQEALKKNAENYHNSCSLQKEVNQLKEQIKHLQEDLKAKEQECEKAKQNAQDTYDLWQALIESFNILQGEKIKLEQECEALGQAYLEINELLQEKTKECTNLKAENGELKEEIDDLKEIIQRHDNDNNALLSEFEDDLVEYYRKYKECLTEIKEIAQYDVYTSGTDLCLKLNWIKKKISECEVKDENN